MPKKSDAPKKNEALLKEIRDNFTYYVKEWGDIRDEGKADMKVIAGDPWDELERKQRENAHRPCLSLDEIGQYLNILINNVRQNKRAIKVNPKGNGATDQTADLRGGIIREVEYKSNAQDAYITAFENAASRSYGFFGIGARYKSDDTFEQELYIRRIPNPDTVLMDPDCKEKDFSDAEGCFVIDKLRKESFKSKYPKAQITDFSAQEVKLAPEWIRDDHIQIAEYWKVKKTPRTLLLMDEQGTTGYLDDYEGAKLKEKENIVVMGDGKEIPITDFRQVEDREVIQYITNGVEILEENPWAGKWIPIIPVIGKEIYVDDGSGSKRVLMSLIRLARDPFMLYCYYRTAQAEVVAMTPKTPFIGAKGQFEGFEDIWKNINQVPTPYVEYNAITVDGAQQPLGPPQRQPYEPAIQQLEIGAEAARRAIQAAVGINPLPTAAQRQNEKSGIALKQIDTEQSLGSFHFVDNFDRALEFAGRQMDGLLNEIYDTARDVGIRKADGTHSVVRINDPEYVDPQTKQPTHLKIDEGDHDVTISTGPSYQSQREEASDFVNTIIQNIEQLPLDPGVKAKFIALLIRLKNLGPIGDEMVKLLSPSNDQEQMQNALQTSKQQLAQMNAYVQQVEQELKKLQFEKSAKVVDNEYRLSLEKLKIDAQMAMAEVTTKAQVLNERIKFVEDVYKQLHDSSHELGLQKDQQAHEADQSQLAQQHEASQAEMAQAQQPQEQGAQ